MPTVVDLSKIRRTAIAELTHTKRRYVECKDMELPYHLFRWIASMSVIEIHATWEKFAEFRLIAAICHNPESFLDGHDIRGIDKIPLGLSRRLVRGSGKYFDFRSVGDLKGIASKFLDDSVNPFYAITKPEEEYLNTLSAIRNYIAHKSDSALVTYKRSLGITYGIKSKPQPDEFLNAVDYRAVSTAKGKPRIIGLLSILNSVVSRI